MSVRTKPSGLPWAARIPLHWDSAKVCLIARLESGHTPSRQHPEYWTPEECTIPWFSLADVWQLREANQKYLGDTAEKISALGVANSAARVLPAGTVVLSRTASVGFSGIMPRPMATTQDFANWVCGPRLLPDYLLWAFRAMKPELARMMMGSTHQTIYMPDIRRLAIPVPPLPEQRAIADFLDHRTTAIDALIERKEQLVAVAEERRAALIGEVVVGVLSKAKRRNTGTPLGAIPEHWFVKRLMYLTAPGRPIMYGIVLPGPNVDEGVSIVKSGNCTRETLRPEMLHRTTLEIEAGYARSRLAADDIVYAIRGSIGMAALVPEDVAGANLTQDAARIAPAPGVNPRWLLYAVQSAPVWAQLAAGIVGATVKGINIRDLKRPFIPVPPRQEQDEIAAYLDAEVGKLDDLEAAAAKSIDGLREYRQALVTAAVTGQLDVAAQEAA